MRLSTNQGRTRGEGDLKFKKEVNLEIYIADRIATTCIGKAFSAPLF